MWNALVISTWVRNTWQHTCVRHGFAETSQLTCVFFSLRQIKVLFFVLPHDASYIFTYLNYGFVQTRQLFMPHNVRGSGYSKWSGFYICCKAYTHSGLRVMITYIVGFSNQNSSYSERASSLCHKFMQPNCDVLFFRSSVHLAELFNAYGIISSKRGSVLWCTVC